MSNSPVDAILLIGPTASGKTAASFHLANRFDSEIISVDSALVYRHMDIGTAKPSQEELECVPHHLIDIMEPEEAYSAAGFCSDSERLIEDIRNRGRLPLLVGGTMLYVKSLLDGISDIPPSSPDIREKVAKDLHFLGLEALRTELAAIDPVTAQRLKPADTQRISRALEVCRMTGRPFSSFLKEKHRTEKRILAIGLMPSERAHLHAQIEKRFDQMLQEGFLDEVRGLMKRPELTAEATSMRCVGYRQAWDYLSGNTSFEDFRSSAIAATRQLAKRQMTWMRSMKNLILVDSCATDALEKIQKEVEKSQSTSR